MRHYQTSPAVTDNQGQGHLKVKGQGQIRSILPINTIRLDSSESFSTATDGEVQGQLKVKDQGQMKSNFKNKIDMFWPVFF